MRIEDSPVNDNTIRHTDDCDASVASMDKKQYATPIVKFVPMPSPDEMLDIPDSHYP